MKIKKNDQVQLIAGKDRGKRGKVLRVFPAEKKVVVEGLNASKKHARSKRQGEKGQRVDIFSPVHVSNVMLVCSRCGKPARVGFRIKEKNKFRICKKCENEL